MNALFLLLLLSAAPKPPPRDYTRERELRALERQADALERRRDEAEVEVAYQCGCTPERVHELEARVAELEAELREVKR